MPAAVPIDPQCSNAAVCRIKRPACPGRSESLCRCPPAPCGRRSRRPASSPPGRHRPGYKRHPSADGQQPVQVVHPVQPGQCPQSAARGAGAFSAGNPGGKSSLRRCTLLPNSRRSRSGRQRPAAAAGCWQPYSVCQYHHLTSLPAPAAPGCGRVVLPQPDRQFCVQGIVLRLLPGVAVGRPRRHPSARRGAGTEHQRAAVPAASGHPDRLLPRTVCPPASNAPAARGQTTLLRSRASASRSHCSGWGFSVGGGGAAPPPPPSSPPSSHLIPPEASSPPGRGVIASVGVRFTARRSPQRQCGRRSLVLHLAVLQHLGHSGRHLHFHAAADLVIHTVDTDEQIAPCSGCCPLNSRMRTFSFQPWLTLLSWRQRWRK